ncbi:hypothetical protein SH528x_002232 [Novipirellula sp. SH528]|uniref:hypothetical protein n=1 Tax=Novipirellula sp. SH528 TaxID=3454466 RepID=UPI003FA11ACC
MLKTAEPLSPIHQCVAGYRYSVAENRFELYLNGELVDAGESSQRIKPGVALAIGGNRVKKADFYSGTIGEILIFDQLLSESDFQQVTEGLMKKRGITVSQTADPSNGVKNAAMKNGGS